MAPTPTYNENVRDNNECESDVQTKVFPLQIQKVDAELNQQLLKVFTGEKTGFLKVGPKQWFLPSGYEPEAKNYYNFQARPDDVFIITYPRSGTTWTQEMVWLLANDLDYKKAEQIPLTGRFPFFEYSCFVHNEMKSQFFKENQFDLDKCKALEKFCYPGWKYFDEMTERRFIKTHLPFSLLPPNLLDIGCKVIYVARNPKDVAVSFYHLNRSYRTQGFTEDFVKFWKYFKEGLVAWGPYWEHIKEGWNRRHRDNCLFLFYEDMNKALKPSIEKVATFLEKEYSEQDLRLLETHLKIENFKNNESVNCNDHKELGISMKTEENFVRKGKSGGWRSYFTDELNNEADKWIEENLESFDMKFAFLNSK